jgi:CRISPR-associated protein (TIGR02710 family)
MLEEEIIPNLDYKPRHYNWIATPNAESLSDCYLKLRKQLPGFLEEWEVEPKDVCVDYTGGTKTMSVSLTLATIEDSCCYSYVGGDERSKGGVGVVLNGKEKMWFLDNPWDEIAQKEKREISILFNKARYASASEVLVKCIDRVSADQRPFLKAVHEMVIGYDLWDRFKHYKAKAPLRKSLEVLTAIGSERREVKTLVDSVERNIQFLENLIAGPKPSAFYCYDLLANARRRAELEKKFDDAVARLYRVIEILAQTELKEKFGVETSNVKMESIPESLRGDYLLRYQSKDDRKIRIPLYAAYHLLKELGSQLGQEFFKFYEKEFKPLLNIRNSSILAHGFNPVDEDTFEKLFDSTLKFSGTHEKELPQFPVLKL